MHRNAALRRVMPYGKQHVCTAVCATVIGGAVLMSSPALAVAHADYVNWDAVAECESGGDWGADTGNGFYGGLQFKESTWKQFGGTGSPAKASRAEQIAVANRVLAAQGAKAWPKCGPGRIPAKPIPAQLQNPLRDLIKTLWSSLPR